MAELATTQLLAAKTQAVLAAADELNQYLTFHVQGERFAIGILDVNEIIEVGAMTRVPMTPNFIQGVINLRGSVVPVVNLAARLGRQPSQISKRSCIVLVELDAGGDGQIAGMLVDEVNEILEIPPGQMQAAPDFGTDIRTDFIQRMGRVGEHFIVLLEIRSVLSVHELANLLASTQGGGQQRGLMLAHEADA
jgi:purine-binding chemotaxis protein CheW